MGGKGSKAKAPKAAKASKKEDAEKVSKISFQDGGDKKADQATTNGTTTSNSTSPEGKGAKPVPKSVASRLSAPVASAVPEEDSQDSKPKATKLFEAPKGPERSKIYQALNPQKLYYESRREKAEAEEEKEVIVIGQRDFGFLKDAEGNLIEEDDDEEEEEEEDYDPENLPDFGEYQAEMDRLRAERARKQDERRRKLREEYERKKAEEEAARQRELEVIARKEAELKAKEETNADDFVEQARDRLEKETTSHLRRFSFRD